MFSASKSVLEALEKGLNLEEGFITSKCCGELYDRVLRLLFYP